MNICFDTFGCRLNRAEALDDEAKCLALGHRIVKSHAEADVIVVRGCSVTSRAQHDCEKLLEHLRHHYPNKIVHVTGCLKDAKELPFRKTDYGVPTSTARAYLKVQDGCDAHCSYCIIPSFRGKSRSTPLTEVLDRAKRFIDAGYHELVVTGCNLSQYTDGGRRLAELTAELAGLSDGCRIRIGSVEPGAVASDLVDVIAERSNVCNFLHLAIQSGSDRILAMMRRPYRIKDVHDLCQKANRLIPTIGLGCDMISGFPGESAIDHNQSLALVDRHGFVNIHAFPFSSRPGTAAEQMRPAIDRAVRSERAHELSDAGERRKALKLLTFRGRVVEVLVESDGPVSGWTAEYLPFRRIESPSAPGTKLRKQLRNFIVTKVDDGVLYGVSG